MSVTKSQLHFGRIILYRDKFALNGISSFVDFINALDGENFSPYFLLIHRIGTTNDYHLEVEYIPNMLDNPILVQWIFLDVCTLKYLEEKREIVLEASISIFWLILQIIIWAGLFVFFLYLFNLSGYKVFLLFTALSIIPPIMIFGRDLHRFKRIRAFAGKQE